MSTKRKTEAGMLLAYVFGMFGPMSPIERLMREKSYETTKAKVILGEMIRMCPGWHHAWFESNVGVLRKPL